MVRRANPLVSSHTSILRICGQEKKKKIREDAKAGRSAVGNRGSKSKWNIVQRCIISQNWSRLTLPKWKWKWEEVSRPYLPLQGRGTLMISTFLICCEGIEIAFRLTQSCCIRFAKVFGPPKTVFIVVERPIWKSNKIYPLSRTSASNGPKRNA